MARFNYGWPDASLRTLMTIGGQIILPANRPEVTSPVSVRVNLLECLSPPGVTETPGR